MQKPGFVKDSWSVLTATLVLLLLVQQVCTAPVHADTKTLQTQDSADSTQILRRIARMTPLWRIMNSKPYGAYCQNNFECSTGFCRNGYCSTNQPKTR